MNKLGARKLAMGTPITHLTMKIALPVLILLALLLPTTTAVSSNSLANGITVNLTIYGAPPGSHFLWRAAPNFTTINTTITGYVTKIPIWVSNSTISTYHGAVSWQYQGAGTTLSQGGSTYTMLTKNVVDTCTKQIINITNLSRDNCIFYLYLNASLWTSNEMAELKAVNASYANALVVVGGISTENETAQYSGIASAGSVVGTAQVTTVATVNAIKVQSFTFVNTTIIKNQSYICLNLTSPIFSRSFCGAGTFSLPLTVINGHFGINGPTSIPITATLSSSLAGTQTTTYDAIIKDKGSIVFSATNLVANTFSTTKTFTYSVGDQLNITLDGVGNANYSSEDPTITAPPNTVYYFSANTVSGNVMAANTQVLFTINAGAISPAILDANVMNFEGAFNGVTGNNYNCWLEGNALNVAQTTSLGSSNTLNVWCTISEGGWLTDNNIYFGISANTINNLNSLGSWGEMPLLSPQYGQFDNGAKVFINYWNFAGTSTPSGWTLGSGQSISNGLVFANNLASTGRNAVYSGTIPAAPTITDFYTTLSAVGASDIKAYGFAGGFYTTGTGYTIALAGQGAVSTAGWVGYSNNGAQAFAATPYTGVGIYTITFVSTSEVLYQQNYGTASQTTTDIPASGASVGGSIYYGTGWTVTFQRIRLYPTNGVLPTPSFGPLVALAVLPSLTYGANPITYGTSTTVTASCTPTSDNCAVWLNGAQLANAIGNVIYTIPSYSLGVGTYNYVANDLTNLLTANVILTVNQATPLLYFPVECATSIFGQVPCTTTAGITTYNSQLTGNLYLNSGFVGSTTTSISNSIDELGVFTYTFNTLGNANYITGSNSYSFTLDENVLVQNAIGTAIVTIGSSPFKWPSYYPIEIYTQSPFGALTYTLTQTLASTITALESNVPNIAYVPPSNQPTGNYIYTVYEYENGDPYDVAITVAANTLNMTDVPAALTFNSYSNGCIQYFPCQATIASFTAPPSLWKIMSDIPVNIHANVAANDIFSNATQTLLNFPGLINLTYNQFSPSVSFTLNAVNNPHVQGSLTQRIFSLIASNTVPGAPYTRNTINISSFKMQDLTSLFANTVFNGIITMNNYSIQQQSTFFNGTSFTYFIAHSTFQNPSITISNIQFLSTAGGYVNTQNNECMVTLASGQTVAYNLYLPYNNASSTSYQFEIYSGSSYIGPGYYLQVLKGTSLSSTLVQQYSIGVVPFTLVLPSLQSFGFGIFNPCGNLVYATNFTVWTSPIKIFISSSQNTPVLALPNITVSCQEFGVSNTLANIECAGIDIKDIITSWTVTLYNNSLTQGWVISNSFTFTGNSFVTGFNGVSNTLPLQVIVTATGGSYIQSYTFPFNYGLVGSGLSLIDRAFLSILFLLVGLGIEAGGSGTGVLSTRHMISTTFMIEAMMMALVYILGISIFTGPVLPTLLTLFLILFGAIMYGYELNVY